MKNFHIRNIFGNAFNQHMMAKSKVMTDRSMPEGDIYIYTKDWGKLKIDNEKGFGVMFGGDLIFVRKVEE
jgi:hypothetical protein